MPGGGCECARARKGKEGRGIIVRVRPGGSPALMTAVITGKIFGQNVTVKVSPFCDGKYSFVRPKGLVSAEIISFNDCLGEKIASFDPFGVPTVITFRPKFRAVFWWPFGFGRKEKTLSVVP